MAVPPDVGPEVPEPDAGGLHAPRAVIDDLEVAGPRGISHRLRAGELLPDPRLADRLAVRRRRAHVSVPIVAVMNCADVDLGDCEDGAVVDAGIAVELMQPARREEMIPVELLELTGGPGEESVDAGGVDSATGVLTVGWIDLPGERDDRDRRVVGVDASGHRVPATCHELEKGSPVEVVGVHVVLLQEVSIGGEIEQDLETARGRCGDAPVHSYPAVLIKGCGGDLTAGIQEVHHPDGIQPALHREVALELRVIER